MKVVTYNIQFSRGKDDKYNLPRVVEAIGDADIIALQEVERFWPRTGMSDQPAEISSLLPNHYWIYGPGPDLDASIADSNGKVTNRRRQFGNMLLSRWPILSSRNHLLPFIGTTSHGNSQCNLLEGVIDTGKGTIRVYSLHLSHQSQRERLLNVEFLLNLNRRVSFEGGVQSGREKNNNDWQPGPLSPMPFDGIYLGDFNFEPTDQEYDCIVGPLDPDYGRVNYRDLLIDAWVAAGNNENDGITFPPNPNYPKTKDGWRLDYCFVTPTLEYAVKKAWIDIDAQGSDHQPMWVELKL
jgi:endonuclease/exonuclease/phosphatase family metal-dependent hydrolase